jgi:homoserine dehydrogenase
VTTRLALVGFGHVGRAFARLLLRQREILRDEHGIDAVVTAVLTRRHGWARDDRGLDLETLLASDALPQRDSPPLIAALSADVLVEVSTLDARTGQPALQHVRDALRSGMHVVTANKGPIAHAYRELVALARERDRALRFEATLADDLPVFNLVRYALPTARVVRLRGIVNSTTNYILSEVARGSSFAGALAEAKRLGIAERDPSNDLDGWDAAAKATILANVLLGARVGIGDVERERITPAVGEKAAAAARRGKRVRPIVTVTSERLASAPATLERDDPLFAVDGFSMALEVETDVAGTLVVSLHDPHVEQTAFALVADLVDVARATTKMPV